MRNRPIAKTVILASLSVFSFAVMAPGSAGSWPSRKKPTPVVTVPPPPPMALGMTHIRDAAIFRTYVQGTSSRGAGFASGADVEAALQAGAASETATLIRGAIAFGAIAALQDKDFVDGIRAYARDANARRDMAARLRSDPNYATGFVGAASAAGLAREAIGSAGTDLGLAGLETKKAAYDVQHQAWSKVEITDRAGRLQAAKAGALAPMTPLPSETARLEQAWNGRTPLGVTAAPSSLPISRLVSQSLALAALAALGEAGDENADNNRNLAQENQTQSCLSLSKVYLNSCLSVAKPYYEDVFCLGQHIQVDTGVCLIRASGSPVPPQLLPPPRTVEASSTARPYKPVPKPVVRKPVKKKKK